jgi:hypothetical protein
MEQSINHQDSESGQSATQSQPIVKLAQRVSEWTKQFFTLTEEEKNEAGICGYKEEHP